MSNQPPSFEPGSRRDRPDAEGAKIVRSTSEQLDEWAATGPKPARSARRSMLEQELGMEAGEASGQAASRGQEPARRASGASRARPGGSAKPVRDPAERSSTGSESAPPAFPPRKPDLPSRSQQAAVPPTQVAPRPTASPGQGESGVPGSGGPGGPGGPSRPAGPTTPPAKPRRRRWLRRTLILVLVLVVFLVAWPFYLVHYGNSKLSHVDALSGHSGTPGTTYLIVGSDKREAGGIQDVTEGERADTIMLLQIPDSGKPSLVSLPRDAYVKIPGHKANKINSAYSTGGAKLLVATVEELSGMTIDHYLEVSMGGVKDLVDAVGGVNLCYDRDVDDVFSRLTWKAGCHDADGTTALAFSRMRKSDPLGDIGRTMRQRQVVSKVVGKAVSVSTFVNPFKQRKLVGSVAKNLTTDKDTGIMGMREAAFGLREVMGKGGLMGAPPIASLNYRVGGQSAVALDTKAVDGFFEKMKNGTLTSADFYQGPGGPVG